jgi:cell division protein FtsB
MGGLSSLLRRQGLNLILAAVLAALSLNGLFGPEGPRDLLGLSRERSRLLTENDQLRAENLRLTVQIGQLRSDSSYLERLIRQQLGYARPDEFIYYFRSNGQSGQ